MAHGILELKESQNNEVEPGMETSIQYFLDRFYMSRISIRMLINQHSKLALDDAHWSLLERNVLENFAAILFGQIPQKTTEHIGCIEIDCNPRSVVNDAYENARWLCDQYYLGAPEMEIIEHNGELKLWAFKTEFSWRFCDSQNLKRASRSKSSTCHLISITYSSSCSRIRCER